MLLSSPPKHHAKQSIQYFSLLSPKNQPVAENNCAFTENNCTREQQSMSKRYSLTVTALGNSLTSFLPSYTLVGSRYAESNLFLASKLSRNYYSLFIIVRGRGADDIPIKHNDKAITSLSSKSLFSISYHFAYQCTHRTNEAGRIYFKL